MRRQGMAHGRLRSSAALAAIVAPAAVLFSIGGDIQSGTAPEQGVRVAAPAVVAAAEAAPLGVSAAAASFKDGNLIDGLISAVNVISAGISPA